MTDSPSDDGSDDSRRERLDELFEALADTQRRQVVRYFQRTEDDVASIDDLVDFAIETGSTEATRPQLEQTFRHLTLPKLADLGVVEYDTRSGAVRYHGSPALERVFTAAVEADLSTE